ncbi:MAG: ABC transporter ATP-binding protein/permease, partial [Gemmatimonadetes bacterium]|nr:ABC transporter ATP-binding protein/permease [Gemmatimonadota bacterium]
MSKESLRRDRAIVERYLEQPVRLPRGVERAAREALGGRVRLYALVDLDDRMNLVERWLVLGDERVAVVADRAVERVFERDAVQAVRAEPGLSATLLHVLGTTGAPPLAEVRYTHRQRRAVENIRFVLEQDAEGATVQTGDPDVEYARAVAGPVREAQALVAGNRRAVLWRLLDYLRPYQRRMVQGFVAATVITLVSLVPPWLAGFLIDEVVRPVQDGTIPLAEGAAVAWLAVGAMAGVYLVRQAAALVRLRLMSVVGEYVARDLRKAVYEHLQRMGMGYFSRKKTGGLITRVTSDTDRLWEFLAFGVVDVSLSGVMLLGLSTVLLSLDWRLGLVMVVPVPLFCWVIFRHGHRMERLFLRTWRKWSGMTDVLGDTLPGIKVVKAFSQEAYETGRFGERNYDVTEEANRLHHAWTTFWPTLMLAIHGTTVLVWAFAVPRLLGTGAEGVSLTAGTFVSFLLYTTMFIHPIEVIGQMTRTMNRATSSAHRVFEVLDTEPEVVDRERPVRLEPVGGRVTFEDVTFAYDGVRQVLKGVSFDVAPGEMIGLVGPSGGGKTTVVNLIARFYDATGGCVRVDGVDVRDLDSAHFRRQVGMVLQDPYLFFGTVADNIRYGHPEARPEAVVAAARAANAHDFIVKLPQGYDTVVG